MIANPYFSLGIFHTVTWFTCTSEDEKSVNYLDKLMIKIFIVDYSRYLHQKVDSSISGLNIDVDLDGEFRDHWAKGLPFQFEGAYKEQPGLQPHIR